MTKDKFLHFWDNIIYGFAVNLQKKYFNDLSFNSDTKEVIWLEYESYKKSYKKYAGFREDQNIDRHKVASLFTLAIINSEPLKIKKGSVAKKELYIVNVNLATQSAITLLFSWLVKEFKEQKFITENTIHFVESHEIDYPETTKEEGITYLQTLTRELYRSQNSKIVSTTNSSQIVSVINVLSSMLAHVFFFIEVYNKEQIRDKLNS